MLVPFIWVNLREDSSRASEREGEREREREGERLY
jgi:hypothetical protein